MNRKILEEMEKIFDNLKSHVSDDDKGRILNVTRHITPAGDAKPVCEFVKSALEKDMYCSSQYLSLFKYREQRYLLLDEKFREGLSEIGFEFEDNDAIIQGAGMLAIASKLLPFRQEISSLQIIEKCLGVEADDKDNICFDFSQIKSFFRPYCVVIVDDSRFQLSFTEDLNRLMCYLLIEKSNKFERCTKTQLKNLLLLLSSRSIAGCILNSIQSSLLEYVFLQIYQCIEYLFRLNNSFNIAVMHGIPLEKSIDIILAHELKISESENLYQVIKDNASDAAIDNFIQILPTTPSSDSDTYRMVANYIYKLRCNIAHLRYQQDDISNVDWEKCIAASVEVLYSIYQKLDNDIIQVCNSKNTWTVI